MIAVIEKKSRKGTDIINSRDWSRRNVQCQNRAEYREEWRRGDEKMYRVISPNLTGDKNCDSYW